MTSERDVKIIPHLMQFPSKIWLLYVISCGHMLEVQKIKCDGLGLEQHTLHTWVTVLNLGTETDRSAASV